MEVEFKDDHGRATGKRVYLQLKSGRSHLRLRKRDDARLFQIPKPRHAEYWSDQAFPVFLIIGDDSGDIEWMDVGKHLRQLRTAGQWPVRSLVFVGERFDVMSVRRWRAAALERG